MFAAVGGQRKAVTTVYGVSVEVDPDIVFAVMGCGRVGAPSVGDQFSTQGGTEAKLASGECVFDPGVDKLQGRVMAKVQERSFRQNAKLASLRVTGAAIRAHQWPTLDSADIESQEFSTNSI